MSFKDVVGFVFSAKGEEPVIQALESLAQRGAYATATLLALRPDPVVMAGGVFAPAVWAQVSEQYEDLIEKERSALVHRCESGATPIVTRTIMSSPALMSAEAATHARYAEVSIMLRPEGNVLEDYRSKLFEALLFDSGRPALLIPPNWRGPIGQRVVVGWNGKREAARALSDAMPFLTQADDVHIVTVNVHPDRNGVSEASGQNITAHLARMGVQATLWNVDGAGRESGETLLAEAKALEANLIVIGGYGRARFSEFIFGGVTRALSRVCDIPVFLSH